MKNVIEKLNFIVSPLKIFLLTLHTENISLNMEKAELENKLKAVDKFTGEAPKTKGGSYAANNATGIKRLVELQA